MKQLLSTIWQAVRRDWNAVFSQSGSERAPRNAAAKKRGPVTVTFDDDAVRVRGRGVDDRVRWAALERVLVETNALGPWAEDVFFLLAGDDGTGCIYPSGAPGAEELLRRLQRLDGFDNRELIAAVGSTSEARFVCWQRAARTPTA